jgi:hypothetical protein
MSQAKKTRSEILDEMVSIVAAHLEKMPVAERKQRVAAAARFVNRGEKRAASRPKATSSSRIRAKSRRSSE